MVNLQKIQQKIIKGKFFPFLIRIFKKFPQAEIYLVGGAVRDLLLKRKTKDFDFVVRKVIAYELENFLKTLGIVNLVGRAFGVFKFVPKGWDKHNPLDLALPRTEHAFGTGGYKDVDVQSSPDLPIKDDLSRRDFTINAMAFKLEIKKFKLEIDNIVDPFKGLVDLKKGIIRTVGKPKDRFQEDYSRMLRAIRFACELGFAIEKKTWQTIKKEIKHLNDLRREVKMIRRGQTFEQEVEEIRVVPLEIIAKEFLKSLTNDPVKTFDLYEESQIWRELMPEILAMKNCPQPKEWHSEGDVWIHTRLALAKLFSPQFKKQFGEKKHSSELILSTLLHDLGKPYTLKTPEKDGVDRIRFDGHDLVGAELAEKIARRLKLASVAGIGIDYKKLFWLVRSHMLLIHAEIEKIRSSTIEKYFFHPYYSGDDLLKLTFVDTLASFSQKGQPDLKNFYAVLKRIREFKKLSAQKNRLPKPILNGNEIISEFGLRPGPIIGQMLKFLREKQLNGQIRTKKQAFDFLRKNLK